MPASAQNEDGHPVGQGAAGKTYICDEVFPDTARSTREYKRASERVVKLRDICDKATTGDVPVFKPASHDTALTHEAAKLGVVFVRIKPPPCVCAATGR